jgi:exonuclease III
MAAYRFFSAASLYAILGEIESSIATGDWNSATTTADRTRDEAQYQSSTATNKREWREFSLHAGCIDLTIQARDREGCADELILLRRALAKAIGPDSPSRG